MNYKTIYHCKTIQVQQYVNDKIGLEDSFPKEKPDAECIKELNDRIEEMAKVTYPWLYTNGKPVAFEVVDRHNAIPVVEVERPISQNDRIKQQISQCSDVKVLETFKLLASKNTELLLAYNARHAELSQKQTA